MGTGKSKLTRQTKKTPFGLHQFRVMPFGLCNAPGTFQRLMELVLAGLHWTCCLVYLDDIIIYSKTVEDHFHKLREVFKQLERAGLKVKPSKCSLMQKSVCYLGHVVSEGGVATDPEKTKCVAEWPVPANIKELRQFLGLASYYRRFVKNFARIATPLYQLTEKRKEWSWTKESEEAFATLKQRLTTSPVLSFPRFNQEFILDTDASSFGLGAVLSQKVGWTRASDSLCQPDAHQVRTKVLCHSQGNAGPGLGSTTVSPIPVWSAFHSPN